MFFVTYNAALITTSGKVIPLPNVQYTDAATVKGIKQDLARDHNVSVDAIVVSEVSRKVIA